MVRVQVCRGMGCSAYGGGRMLADAMERALEKAGVRDRVELLSAHCMGECESGPCVRVNGQKFYHIHTEDVPTLVRDEILPLIDV